MLVTKNKLPLVWWWMRKLPMYGVFIFLGCLNSIFNYNKIKFYIQSNFNNSNRHLPHKNIRVIKTSRYQVKVTWKSHSLLLTDFTRDIKYSNYRSSSYGSLTVYYIL